MKDFGGHPEFLGKIFHNKERCCHEKESIFDCSVDSFFPISLSEEEGGQEWVVQVFLNLGSLCLNFAVHFFVLVFG